MKKVILFFTAAVLSAAMSLTAFAGEWKLDDKGYWYLNDDGSYPKESWREIDGKHYYFDSEGYMLADTTTPDGYRVGADGSWIEGEAAAVSDIDSSYQAVLDTYTEKLKAETTKLIEEYKTEAAVNTKGFIGLSDIRKNKVAKLAAIEAEGAIKMTEVYHQMENGNYNELEEWAEKLKKVYQDEARKIEDTYRELSL